MIAVKANQMIAIDETPPSDSVLTRVAHTRAIVYLSIFSYLLAIVVLYEAFRVDAVRHQDLLGLFACSIALLVPMLPAIFVNYWALSRLLRLTSTGWVSPWPLWSMRVHTKYQYKNETPVEVAITLPVRTTGRATWRVAAAWRCPQTSEAMVSGYRDSVRVAGIAPDLVFERRPELERQVRVVLGQQASVAVVANDHWALVLATSATRPDLAARQLLSAAAMNAGRARGAGGATGERSMVTYHAQQIDPVARPFLTYSAPVSGRFGLGPLAEPSLAPTAPQLDDGGK